MRQKKFGLFWKSNFDQKQSQPRNQASNTTYPKHNIDDLSSGVIRIIHKQNGTSNSSVRSGLEQNLLRISSRYYTGSGGQGMLTIRAASSGLQNERLRLFHVDGGKNSLGTLFSINAQNMKASTAVKIYGKGVLLKVHSKRHKYNHSIVSMSAIQNVMRISYSSPGSTNNIRVLQVKQSRGSSNNNMESGGSTLTISANEQISTNDINFLRIREMECIRQVKEFKMAR